MSSEEYQQLLPTAYSLLAALPETLILSGPGSKLNRLLDFSLEKKGEGGSITQDCLLAFLRMPSQQKDAPNILTSHARDAPCCSYPECQPGNHVLLGPILIDLSGNPIITMSRRESRSSLGARQNDALVEFETFKKKFLLANKHITKLNSTLSVRIEELNAQISMLYVENLRLRASEIALTAQLKKEREKSHKVIADAETAAQNLAKHLIYLRETHNIRTVSTEPPTPPSPRARRPVLDISTTPTSPQLNRISRPPNVPGIYEEDEPSGSEEEVEKQATPPRRKSKSKPRLSTSKLPLPTRGPSPTPTATTTTTPTSTTTTSNEAISASSKPRKTIRRQSGLLSVNTEALSVPRSGSPAFGSPIRLEAGRAEEAEEFAAVHSELEVTITTAADLMAKKERRKGKAKDEAEGEVVSRQKEKKRPREEVDSTDILKPKVKDTTVPRTALQPIDSNVFEQTDTDGKTFLRPGSPDGSAPTSRGSTSPAPTGSSELEGMQGVSGNRERRTRKSVNYAEPKLNTKMRKPDNIPGLSEPAARKKRSSAAAVMTSSSYKPPSSSSSAGNDVDADNDNDNDDAMGNNLASDPPLPVPLPLRGTSGNYINPELFPLPPSRPGSAAAMYSPGPPTRTTGSTTSGSSIASYSTSTSSSNTAATVVRKKKSRPQITLSDDESDGAEADEEYMGGGAGTKGAGAWVNVEGRRKALPKRSAATAAVAALEDIRRHSMVI